MVKVDIRPATCINSWQICPQDRVSLSLQFPAITICGQGWIGDVMTTSLLKQYREFAKNDPEYQKAADPPPPEDSGE